MHHFDEDGLADVMEPGGRGRMWISLAALAVLGCVAWLTMEAGRPRTVVVVLLGFFAVRIVLLQRRFR